MEAEKKEEAEDEEEIVITRSEVPGGTDRDGEQAVAGVLFPCMQGRPVSPLMGTMLGHSKYWAGHPN